MKQRLIYNSFIIVSMFIVLYFMNKTYYEIEETYRTMNFILNLDLRNSALFFLFGILLEWKNLYRVIRGQVNVNWPFIAWVIPLVFISFIPSFHWVNWFGMESFFIIDILSKPIYQGLLSTTAGILLTRSMVSDEINITKQD